MKLAEKLRKILKSMLMINVVNKFMPTTEPKDEGQINLIYHKPRKFTLCPFQKKKIEKTSTAV